MRIIRKSVEVLLDLIYPRRCPVCDDIVPYGEKLICNECRQKIVYIKEPRCRKCGKQLFDDKDIYCTDCSHKKHEYVVGYALYDYGNMKHSIYKFKYKGRAEYAKFYAEDISKRLKYELEQINPQGFVPVPIHKERYNARGYNQAELIAEELTKITGIPTYKYLVRRVKNTKPQKELDGVQRQNNLKKAFNIPADVVKLNRIVLIDDIYTTGSTIDTVANELKRHGVGEIYFITLCIGEGI